MLFRAFTPGGAGGWWQPVMTTDLHGVVRALAVVRLYGVEFAAVVQDTRAQGGNRAQPLFVCESTGMAGVREMGNHETF